MKNHNFEFVENSDDFEEAENQRDHEQRAEGYLEDRLVDPSFRAGVVNGSH